MKLSVIIPCYREGQGLVDLLQQLQKIRHFGHEIILVDGSEAEYRFTDASQWVDHYVRSKKGRAYQMNVGAKLASGNMFWFVHADSRLSDQVLVDLLNLQQKTPCWGRFNVCLDGQGYMFRLLEMLMNVRSCVTSIATGDQAIFIQSELFRSIGGFPRIALMEDIAISKQLKQRMKPLCQNSRVTTSARRWKKNGIWRTILLMWSLRLAYFFGADPAALSKKYQSF